MSDNESDLASVTSSVAQEQTSVAFKAPVVTPAASSDMDLSPGADTMEKPGETADLADVKTEETEEQNCADTVNEQPRKPIVHVDEIWDKEKRRFMIFTPTDDVPMSQEQKNCILLVRHTHPRDIRHNVRTTVEVRRKGLRMLMRKIFLGAAAFTWGDRNDLEPKWFFWARPHLVNLRKHCTETGHEQILLEIDAALSFCREHYESSWESIGNLQKENRIRFRDVWTIFPPNTLVTGRDKLGHRRVWKVEDGWRVEYGEHKNKFQLDVQYAESDGKNFGWASDSIYIHPFSGARLLDHLAVQPLHLLANRKTVEKSLRSRAAAQLKLHNERFTLRQYIGHGLIMDERPDGDIGLKKQHFRGKIMIDPAKALEINPEHLMPPVYEFATSDFEHQYCNVDEPDGRDFKPGDLLSAYDNNYDEDDLGPKGSSLIFGLSYDDEPLVMYAGPGRSHQPSRQQEEAALSQKPLSDFQRLLLSGLVYGYDLKFGNWAAFSVSLVKEFSWNDTAFDALVMETKLKTRLGSLIKAYGRKIEGTGFDDFIKEKGLGLIGLLFGKPGLGKTFTAEAIAEMARLPLMMVSAGSLGSQPDKIEKNLRDTLDVAARWRAVLLFDEADVFLAKRDATSIERNAVVSVFLRELEYFPGILLLTTNKKDLIDEAFQSRVHFCHAYPELDFQARVKIWKEFVMQTINHTALRVEINSKGYERLGRKEYNGREIKNIMSMATMSALDRTPPILTTDDILEISSTLQNWDAVSVHERASTSKSATLQQTKSSVFSHIPDRGDRISRSTLISIGTWLLASMVAAFMAHIALPRLTSEYHTR